MGLLLFLGENVIISEITQSEFPKEKDFEACLYTVTGATI